MYRSTIQRDCFRIMEIDVGFACGKYLVMALAITCIVLYFAAHTGSVHPNCIAWRCTRRERPDPTQSRCLLCAEVQYNLDGRSRSAYRNTIQFGRALPECAPKHSTIWMDAPRVCSEKQYTWGGRSRSVYRNTIQFEYTEIAFRSWRLMLGLHVGSTWSWPGVCNLDGCSRSVHRNITQFGWTLPACSPKSCKFNCKISMICPLINRCLLTPKHQNSNLYCVSVHTASELSLYPIPLLAVRRSTIQFGRALSECAPKYNTIWTGAPGVCTET